MGGSLKWTRKTTRKISRELGSAGITVSANTVGRLLEELRYALRVNHKKHALHASHPDRNRQFDTKKKELVGRFKNPGAVWAKAPIVVNDHDFRSDAIGMAIPYGIYDIGANQGHLFVGTSHDTPAFAADAIARWWVQDGRPRYPKARELLILADSGGSNGPRNAAWKHHLQAKLCDRHGLRVTVCHYPPGTSKWNPIEHRLFGELSKNWAGVPLESYDTILNYIRSTTTETGLKVKATLLQRHYPTGIRVAPEDIADLHLRPRNVLPLWNYTIECRQ